MLGFLDDHLISVAANGTARWWSLTGKLDAEVRVDARPARRPASMLPAGVSRLPPPPE